MSKESNEIIKLRKKRLSWLIGKKINPYCYSFNKKNNSIDITKKFSKIKKGSKTKTKVSIAGRIITSRIMGKASFFTIQDQTGRVQIFATKDTLKNYDIIKKLDHGDIVGVKGFVFKTKTGEITIHAKEFSLLTKSLRPLPSKWHGLKDKEERYRKRYLDLISNPEIKEIFIKRTKIINFMRDFLTSKGFIEVDTPVLQPIYGGTNARPFKTHLNALNTNVYLRISNELYLKRLIVGGYEKIFEFSKDFRNEGIDKSHNPEFLLMETMWAYADYKDNMKLCEEMINYIVKKIHGKLKFKSEDVELDFTKWKKLSFSNALKKYAKIDITKIKTIKQAKNAAKKFDIDTSKIFTKGEILSDIFEEAVEPKLIQPTMIYDFPKEQYPLAKEKRDNSEFAEAFEPYVKKMELGLSYSEQNDPKILEKTWEKAEKFFKKGDEEAQRMDKDFLNALEIGMPPTSGLGIGVDRLVMIITGQPSIRDVIFFPFMRQ